MFWGFFVHLWLSTSTCPEIIAFLPAESIKLSTKSFIGFALVNTWSFCGVKYQLGTACWFKPAVIASSPWRVEQNVTEYKIRFNLQWWQKRTEARCPNQYLDWAGSTLLLGRTALCVTLIGGCVAHNCLTSLEKPHKLCWQSNQCLILFKSSLCGMSCCLDWFD